VLVYHDLLGYQEGGPRFVKQYAQLGPEIQRALEAYAADVRAGSFPEQQHTYSMPEEELALFDASLLEAEQGSER
jgi:3-methyl-2-oxobutanoate hydroxymethyltransferase